MNIELKKFGTTLISRQAGKEALAALQPLLREVPKDDLIKISFDGVITFTPSWADEFITPLKAKYGDQVVLLESDNPSVIATLEILN